MTDKVKVYSTPQCPYCKMVKEFLEENKIKFDDVDVSKDHDAAHEMVEKTGQLGVPVIIINDKDIVVGFDKDNLKKYLKLK